VDDQACVIDDEDDEGKARVCEDKGAVCNGRSNCSPDDGAACVGGKVCCSDASETPCDASGASTRVCCDLAVDECRKDASGDWDCYSKEGAPAPPPPPPNRPPSGRRRRLLLEPPAWAMPVVAVEVAGSRPGRARRADLATAEGRAARREARLANRRGLTPAERAMPPWARAAAAGRPRVVVTTWEDAHLEGAAGTEAARMS
jgi:hypothetical protein